MTRTAVIDIARAAIRSGLPGLLMGRSGSALWSLCLSTTTADDRKGVYADLGLYPKVHSVQVMSAFLRQLERRERPSVSDDVARLDLGPHGKAELSLEEPPKVDEVIEHTRPCHCGYQDTREHVRARALSPNVARFVHVSEDHRIEA
jgi:hypothetical protein